MSDELKEEGEHALEAYKKAEQAGYKCELFSLDNTVIDEDQEGEMYLGHYLPDLKKLTETNFAVEQA